MMYSLSGLMVTWVPSSSIATSSLSLAFILSSYDGRPTFRSAANNVS